MAVDADYDEPEGSRITLVDVAGMERVKARIERTFLAPLRAPEVAKAFGATGEGGLLLYGPPGCGKTYIARALAGELRARFLAVGVADVLDMWIGSSERNMHGVFATARRRTPCVVFLDELDALGHRRANLRYAQGQRSTVNQLLMELDGVVANNAGVFVLGASNQPWEIDPALRRPGRLDRPMFVPPPDDAARLAILAANLRDKAITEDLELGRVADRTAGYSGTDVRAVCEAAAEGAMERSLNSGEVSPISNRDLAVALKAVRPSIGSWFETAQNVATFSNNDGEFDDLLSYLSTSRA